MMEKDITDIILVFLSALMKQNEFANSSMSCMHPKDEQISIIR